ncbi:hypothetical protein LWI28_004716 [Acer negundo]|uniref:t-SNARE coiled-coil homology domain-containing protein n=1 Tax=Acer negundo TaxID=4023 RepID=A0AAD5NH11_ACENE|nr:hypothetical protein LWI28_004716 [Acer negundo]
MDRYVKRKPNQSENVNVNVDINTSLHENDNAHDLNENGHVDGLNENIDDFNDNIEDLNYLNENEHVDGLNENIDDLNDNIKDLNENVDDLNDKAYDLPANNHLPKFQRNGVNGGPFEGQIASQRSDVSSATVSAVDEWVVTTLTKSFRRCRGSNLKCLVSRSSTINDETKDSSV